MPESNAAAGKRSGFHGASGRPAILLSVALLVIIFAVYWQVGYHEFLNYDDTVYITANPHVATGITGTNIIWALTSVDASNWHPVTWLSHMADAQFYSMNPRGHHLTNVFFHAISTLLLFFLLFRLTGAFWQCAFVAALFGLHPLHVESVAWAAERKDVLSAFFGFLTLIFYAEYAKNKSLKLYLLSLFAFVMGLMSKPMLVTIPGVMLLMDFWPLNRVACNDGPERRLSPGLVCKALLIEKMPFIFCSGFSAAVTIYAQRYGGAMSNFDKVPLGFSIENAVVAYVKYISKTLWPHDLAVFYPLDFSLPLWEVAGSALILLAVSAITVAVRRRYPYLAMGWFWFLLTLVPVIGLIQVGGQSMADRYMYIPSIGLFIMAAWGIPPLLSGAGCPHGVLALLAVSAVAVSAALTYHQIGYWQDDASLFREDIAVTTNNYLAHNNLGAAFAQRGDLDAAIREYREALAINPRYYLAHNNLGGAFEDEGNLDAAIKEYKTALALSPNYSLAHNHLGVAYARKGDLDAAIREYREALALNPNQSLAHLNLGSALEQTGHLDMAIREYQEALRINPVSARAHNSLGVALARRGYLDAAIEEFQNAVNDDANFFDAHNNLGFALMQKGYLDAAIREFREAIRINPGSAKAYNNLGFALARKRMDVTATR